MVSQTYFNLIRISNALKYSQHKDKPQISVGYDTNKKVLFVKDNGIGLKEKYTHKIFNVFTRLSSTDYKGSGIGLTIVKKAINMHNGTILNKGATFFFSFNTI